MGNPNCWVVVPQGPENDEYYYGVRQLEETYTLYIASGCCGAKIKPRKSDYNSSCTNCSRIYPISPHTGFRGEDKPFELYWGQYAWDQVEENMKLWLDFYFNFEGTSSKKVSGEVVIHFNGENWHDFMSKS